MARATEQIASIIKANTENALKAGLLSVEHAERFLDLHVRNIRIALEHSIVALSAIPFATDARKLMALRPKKSEARNS